MLNAKATAALGKNHYLTIDNSVQVLEECSKGKWSRVQVTSPEWLRDTHIGWVPSEVLRGKELDGGGKELFSDADFRWDAKTRPHRATIIAGVNKVARENDRCKDIDPSSASVSTSKGTKADPVFYVTCGMGNSAQNVFFSKSDVAAEKVLAAAKSVPTERAVEMCEQYVRAKANHPSTVKFSGLSFLEHANGRTTINGSFRAKNSFNLELKHSVTCLVDGTGVLEAQVAEAR